MEIAATVLYLRFRNVEATCKLMTLERGAQFVIEARNLLEDAITRGDGVIVRLRPDSVLAAFSNGLGKLPNHARRALHAALVCIYRVMELSKQSAMQPDGALPVPLNLAVGVHLGNIEVDVDLAAGISGRFRHNGEVPEIARALESMAPDLGWSIVATGIARRAAGVRIESGRTGSVQLPDGSSMAVSEITGLAPTPKSRTPASIYEGLRQAVILNRTLYPS